MNDQDREFINQKICRDLVAREVIACANVLVQELLEKAEHFPEYELYDMQQGYPDWEGAAQERGWEHEAARFMGTPSFVHPEHGRVLCATWQEICEGYFIDPDPVDVYEHWQVTDWFAEKLEKQGEKVVYDFFGLTIWCRTTTGQAILMDSCIREIAGEMEILTSQAND